MKFTAAGDAIIQRRIPKDHPGFAELTPFISQGDARFFNLETTLNREGECFASQFSGGTWIRTNPEVLEDLKQYGFNMTSFNNNHAMDFSYDGFLKTLEHVEASGLVNAGCGRNMAAAAAPRYLETNKGRVALIAVNVNFDPSMMAGYPAQRVPGRPGVNGLRLQEKFSVSAEDIAMMRSLAQRTGVNCAREISRKEGYNYPAVPENEAEFGVLRFFAGDETKWIRTIHPDDMQRVLAAIDEAKFQADHVMISIHCHNLSGTSKETPADFLIDFSHACVDAGADAVVGHGPHLLRPIEVYNGKPIFYSLGDFILQLYSLEFAPEDFFRQYGLTSADQVGKLLLKRSKNRTVGLMEDIRMFETVIPCWEMKNGRMTSLELMPACGVKGGHKSEEGLPRRVTDLGFIERLAAMSEPYGVKMEIGKDGIVRCRW